MLKNIRKMKMEDLPDVMKIESIMFSTAWQKEMFLEEIDKQYAYVLEIADKITGYICGWKILDEFNITNIAILHKYQRKGYGAELVAFIMKELISEECFKFFLEVRASNSPAKQLYEKFGFTLIGVRKKYYHSPVEDAQIYGLNLLK